MKRVMQSGLLLMAGAIFLFSTSSCKKEAKPCNPGGGDTLVPIQARIPIELSFYDGTASAYPTVYKFQYDQNNLLTHWGTDSVYSNIFAHGVSEVVFDWPYISGFNYTYRIANSLDTSVSLYDGQPSELDIVFASKDRFYGITNSTPEAPYFFEYGANGLLVKSITNGGDGLNVNQSYDDKGNLKEIDYVRVNGVRAGNFFSKLTVTGYDDKFSPFIAVKGWKWASWPQGYAWQYATAFCNNNPTQITVVDWDDDSNSFKPYSVDDFTYTYNDDGFPTTIVDNTTYTTATTTHYTRTFNYTYK